WRPILRWEEGRATVSSWRRVARWRQRRQPVCGAGPVATLVMNAVDPRGLELPAGRGPQRVNDAANLLADLAVQRDAPRGGLFRAAHDGVMRRQFRRQIRRRQAAGRGVGL